MKVDGKADGSPVTEADLAADRIIARRSGAAGPGNPDAVRGARSAGEAALSRQLLPDRSARRHQGIRRRPQRVHGQSRAGDQRNAAARHHRRARARTDLARHGRPRRGAVDASGDGAAPRVEPIRTRPCPPRGEPWIVAVSRSHGDARTEAFIAARPGAVRAELGSAVKFGRVAEGAVDIYPRLAPTCEWDVAAGHAVVTAAGGKITDSHGRAAAFRQGPRQISSCRNSSPGAIPSRADLSGRLLTAPDLFQRRPARVRLLAGSARDRRQRRRGCPRGRTDKAAVPRSARTADCRR